MDLATLKNRISSNTPIYFVDKKIEIIFIYEIFGLVDIKEDNNEDIFVVDISTLSNKPYFEKSICISKL